MNVAVGITRSKQHGAGTESNGFFHRIPWQFGDSSASVNDCTMFFQNRQRLFAFEKTAHLLEHIQSTLMNFFNLTLGEKSELPTFEVPGIHLASSRRFAVYICFRYFAYSGRPEQSLQVTPIEFQPCCWVSARNI
jgi:hypothetical protein